VYRRCRSFRLSAGMLALVLYASSAFSEKNQTRGNGQLRWKVDLGQSGYQRYPRKRMVRPLPATVDFAGEETVVVSWTEPDATDVRGGPRIGEPSHLHAIAFDGTTGKVQGKYEWPTLYTQSKVRSGPDGALIMCVGSELRVLDPKLETVRRRQLDESCDKAILLLSPTGKTMLVSSRGSSFRRIQIIDGPSLAVSSAWDEPQSGDLAVRPFAISDSSILGRRGRHGSLCYRALEGNWREYRFTDSSGATIQTTPWWMWFVDDQHLALGTGTKSELVLATPEGREVTRLDMGERRFLCGLETVPSASRFAAVECRLRGIRSEPLDMYPFQAQDQVVVYGGNPPAPVYSLTLKSTSPWNPANIHTSSVALSPDGKLLAVLSDSLLSLYALPQDPRAEK
jgi:hypothetical protein